MADYNLALKHKLGKENKIADALSQQPDYDTGENDNKGIVVLPEAMFIKSTMLKDPPPSSALNEAIITALTSIFALLDPLIQLHNLSHSDNLWWKGDTLVIIGTMTLRKGCYTSTMTHLWPDTLEFQTLFPSSNATTGGLT